MRHPRQLKPKARYHVIARANRREMILGSTAMKDIFLSVIKRAKEEYSFSVINYCVMGNHFHLILEPHENENLSRIMQWILSVFAIHFNKTLEISGHVWHDRFWSRIIDDIRSFIAIFTYIVQNPVAAHLVFREFDYEYSGVRLMRDAVFDIIDPPTLLLKLLFPQYASRQILLV
jgi:putative transposase